jgi:hypothetical protein
MTEQHRAGFSEADVQSLGQKLAEFTRVLTSGERRALVEVLQHAMPEENDGQGFSADPASELIEGRLLVVALLDILYPDDL